MKLRQTSLALIAGFILLTACNSAESGAPEAAAPQDAAPAATEPTPEPSSETAMNSVYDITLKTIDNRDLPLSQYQGKPILLVNTASKCGYTPQYEGLQALWTEYEPQGLVVIGMPSDNFGGQEYASNEDIAEFCELNFGVTFPLTARADVVGENRHEIFARAEAAVGEAAIPKWNFHKVLIDANGVPVAAFPSGVTPSDPQLRAAIDAEL